MFDIRFALPPAAQEPGFRRYRRGHARARHRRGRGDVRADPGRPALAAAVCRPRPARAVSPARSRRPAVHARARRSASGLSWRQAQTLEPPALYRWTFNFLVLPDGSQSMGGMVVTPNYFSVARPDADPRPRVHRRGAAPPECAAVGRSSSATTSGSGSSTATRTSSASTIRISRMPAPLPVVGVMPPGMRFLPDPGAASEPNYDVNAHVDFWLGVAPDESQPRRAAGTPSRRLRDGATLAQAQAEIAHARGGPRAGRPGARRASPPTSPRCRTCSIAKAAACSCRSSDRWRSSSSSPARTSLACS